MRLSNNESSFDLKIKDYEFSDISDEEHDSNWLQVKIEVVSPIGIWEATDPCLLTYEIIELANWFDNIVHNKKVKPNLYFIEPNLKFELDKNFELIKVYFALSCWAHFGLREDLCLEFPVQSLGVKKANHSLLKQLSQYPVRGMGDG